MLKPEKPSFVSPNLTVFVPQFDKEQPHNGARTARNMVESGQYPRPGNLLELAQYLEKFQPRLKLPARLLRLLHEETEVSFDRMREIVYKGAIRADYLNVVNDAREKITELRVPYRIDTFHDAKLAATMVKCVECPDA